MADTDKEIGCRSQPGFQCRFYQQFGDETTIELVNWLNSVDADFRNELRERDDRNWDRYRAELKAETASLRTELKGEMAALRLEFSEFRTMMVAEMASFRSEIHAELRSHLRWMFTFWVTTLLALIGLRLV